MSQGAGGLSEAGESWGYGVTSLIFSALRLLSGLQFCLKSVIMTTESSEKWQGNLSAVPADQAKWYGLPLIFTFYL